MCLLPGLGTEQRGSAWGSSLKWWGPKTRVLLAGLYSCTHDTDGQMSQRASPQEEHLRWHSRGSLHTHALKELVQWSVHAQFIS